MAGFDENPILELGRNPIPGDHPCGQDISEEDDYILLDSEAGKLGRIEAGEPDWYAIEQAGLTLLQSKAKDVDVGSAFGMALFQQHKYEGLAAALGLFCELIKNFWEGLLPARPRRRKARIETLTDQFPSGGWFSQHAPGPNDFDALDKCVERVEELESLLTEKMPDDPPDFAKFKRGIKELAGKRPKPAEAAPAPAAAPDAGDAPAPAGAAAAPAGFAGAEVSDRSGAINAALSAASFLRTANAGDPVAYAMVRVVKWSTIELPRTEAAKFEIEPPEKTLVEALTHQYGKGLWENLLKNAEAAYRSTDPLWLDLQRYVCAAMQGLGPDYRKAHDAVVAQTGALVRRLGDGLYELTFRGGMPLCSGETRLWIEAEVAAADSGGEGGAETDGRLAEAAGNARKLAAEGKLKEGLKLLQEGLRGCDQRRERFLWRLRIAQLCYESQRLKVATPLLEECDEEIRRYGVHEWEPSLAVNAVQMLYRCRKLLLADEKAPPPEAVAKVRDSFAWLCQLDPVAALAAEPSGK